MVKATGAIFGGERFAVETGQAADKGSRLPGFMLDKSGILKASCALLNSIEITGEPGFHGEADAGNFKPSPVPIYTAIRSYNGNASAAGIIDNEFSFWGINKCQNSRFDKAVLARTDQISCGEYIFLRYIPGYC